MFNICEEKSNELHRDFTMDQYEHVLELANKRVEFLESSVNLHEQYYDSVQEFSSWINNAKEELNRWYDLEGGVEAVKKKLTKVQVC